MPNSDLEMVLQVMEANIRGIRTEIQTLKETTENSHVEIMDMFKRAFPDGDLSGHQKFHQNMIDDAKNRREMRNEVLKKLAAGTAWSVVAYCGYYIIDRLRDYVQYISK